MFKYLVPALLLVWLVLPVAPAAALGHCDCSNEEDSKVTICHYPPGKDDNPQTLSVSESAVSAHLAHGDILGACSGEDDKNENKGKKSDDDENENKGKKSDDDENENKGKKSDDDENENDNSANENDSVLGDGTPCTCPDGSVGTWVEGEMKGAESMREIQGQ